MSARSEQGAPAWEGAGRGVFPVGVLERLNLGTGENQAAGFNRRWIVTDSCISSQSATTTCQFSASSTCRIVWLYRLTGRPGEPGWNHTMRTDKCSVIFFFCKLLFLLFPPCCILDPGSAMGFHLSHGFLTALWLTREPTYSVLPSHLFHSSVSNRMFHPHCKLFMPPNTVPYLSSWLNSSQHVPIQAIQKLLVASQCQSFPPSLVTEPWATHPPKKLHFHVPLEAWCRHVTKFWLMRGKWRVTEDF